MHVDLEGETQREIEQYLGFIIEEKLLSKWTLKIRFEEMKQSNREISKYLPSTLPERYLENNGKGFKLKGIEILYFLNCLFIITRDTLKGQFLESNFVKSLKYRMITTEKYIQHSHSEQDIKEIDRLQKLQHKYKYIFIPNTKCKQLT